MLQTHLMQHRKPHRVTTDSVQTAKSSLYLLFTHNIASVTYHTVVNISEYYVPLLTHIHV